MKSTITSVILGLALFFAAPQGAEAKNGVLYKQINSSLRATAVASDAAPATQTMLYYGGPVIGRVKVYTVYWGTAIDPIIQNGIDGFYTAMTNSTYMDWLTEYNTNIKAVDGRQGTDQTISRGSYGGAFTIKPTIAIQNINDTDIQAELERQVKSGALPAPTDDTLFMIYFPTGTSITVDTVKSCVDFCAYHNGFKSPVNGNVYYGVMPDLNSGGCQWGCGFAKPFDNVTQISAHEFMEAVTDPFPTPGTTPSFPQAWNDAGGNEIGDLCVGQATTLNAKGVNYVVQKEFDNSINGCAAGPYSVNP